mgnify:CR=1 FL=1
MYINEINSVCVSARGRAYFEINVRLKFLNVIYIYI